MADDWHDESGYLDPEKLARLKPARKYPVSNFGMAIPIWYFDKEEGKPKTAWLDHEGNEI